MLWRDHLNLCYYNYSEEFSCYTSESTILHNNILFRSIRNVTKSAYTAHTEPLHKEYNILKVQDLYQLAILKFYSKLVNNNLPQYFNAFTPTFSVEHFNYNLRNPTRQLPTIRHEFPRQSLRYKLIATLFLSLCNFLDYDCLL